MRNALAKKRLPSFQIDSRSSKHTPRVEAGDLGKVVDSTVNVCLKYYQDQFECFSQWQKSELKMLSNWLNKAHARTVDQITSNTKTCHLHMVAPKYDMPKGLSPDVKIYGLDVGAKQRVHGAFVQNQFFLIWLDREHRVLGKK